jgi:hypothetical protein
VSPIWLVFGCAQKAWAPWPPALAEEFPKAPPDRADNDLVLSGPSVIMADIILNGVAAICVGFVSCLYLVGLLEKRDQRRQRIERERRKQREAFWGYQ